MNNKGAIGLALSNDFLSTDDITIHENTPHRVTGRVDRAEFMG